MWAAAVLLASAGMIAGTGTAAALSSSAHGHGKPCSGPPVGPFGSGVEHALTEPLAPGVVARFAVLRRPAGPEDALPPINSADEELTGELRGYYPAYIRQVAVRANGVRDFLVPGLAQGLHIAPARCWLKRLRRKRAKLVAEQRKREREPLYCIVAVGSRHAGVQGSACEAFSAIGTARSYEATSLSLGETVRLVPDGVATVRVTYRNGNVINAPVGENAFSFEPPQRRIRKLVAALRRMLLRVFETHPGQRRRARLRKQFSVLAQHAVRLETPKLVQWLGASGHVIRAIRPRVPRNTLGAGIPVATG